MSQPRREEQPIQPLADAATDEASGGGHDGRRVNWPAALAFGAIGALIVLILILHLTGVVGPTGHR